jgi:type VI secretion system protein ImpH
MDDETRAAPDSLTQRLRERPYDFDFFQAVRRLESAHPHLARVGHSKRPQGDLVRFCQKVSLAFEPSAIDSYLEAADESAGRLYVTFLGLLGTNGPMPLSITEYVYDRLHNHRDETIACFLDIFNHRMISMFYRAWACNQQTVSHDRREEDRFAFYIGSLFGMGMDSFFNRDAVPDVAKLHYAGRLSCETKNAEGLQEILADYFGVPAAVEEFVEQWIELPREYCCQLGKSVDNASLGSTSIVGSRFLECQQKFRIKCGPMGLSDYERLLPGSESLCRFVTWIRNYIGDELSWELNLVLRREEIPEIRLGDSGRLGWTTWLGCREYEKDADNLVLQNLTA